MPGKMKKKSKKAKKQAATAMSMKKAGKKPKGKMKYQNEKKEIHC